MVIQGGAQGNLPGAAGPLQPAFLTTARRSRATCPSPHPWTVGFRCYDRLASPTPPLGPCRAGRDMLDADHPREACGVFGVWAPGEQVANLVFYGLYALQHRGQESAGMAVADGRGVLVYKEMGLVSQVFDEPTLATLQGHLAIKTNAAGGGIALAHNGNLTNTAALAGSLAPAGPDGGTAAAGRRPSTDTDVMAELLAREADLSLEEAIVRTMPRLEGAFSLVIMDERTLYGVRDRHGVRPLCIGKLPGGWVIASETAALDIVGATLVREVEP